MSSDYGTKKVRKARKQYRCCSCYTEINVGDKYWHLKGYADIIQSFYSERHCMACKDFYDTRKAHGEPVCLGSGMTHFFDEEAEKRRERAFDKSMKELEEELKADSLADVDCDA